MADPDGRLVGGSGRLPGLPFDLDLGLHKGGLSPHRKSGGKKGEKGSPEGPKQKLWEAVAK